MYTHMYMYMYMYISFSLSQVGEGLLRPKLVSYFTNIFYDQHQISYFDVHVTSHDDGLAQSTDSNEQAQRFCDFACTNH